MRPLVRLAPALTFTLLVGGCVPSTDLPKVQSGQDFHDTFVSSEQVPGSTFTYRYVINNDSLDDVLVLRIGEHPDSSICELRVAPAGWNEEGGLSAGSASSPEGWTAQAHGDEAAEADRWCLEFRAQRGRGVGPGKARGGFSVRAERRDDKYLTGFFAVWFADGPVRRGRLHASGQPRPVQKPIDESLVQADYQGPPATMEAMASQAAAIVVGRSNGRRSELLRAGGFNVGATTAFSFEILEVIKPHAALGKVGDSVTLRVAGGELEYPKQIVRERLADSTPIDPAGVYVLFLAEGGTELLLRPAWAVASFYKISSGSVEAVAHAYRSHDGTPADEFLSTLRKAASPR
jgi:hypothetical protein